jgi:hypothetical protein
MQLRSFAGVYPERCQRAQDKFWICDFRLGIGAEVEDVNQGL